MRVLHGLATVIRVPPAGPPVPKMSIGKCTKALIVAEVMPKVMEEPANGTTSSALAVPAVSIGDAVENRVATVMAEKEYIYFARNSRDEAAILDSLEVLRTGHEPSLVLLRGTQDDRPKKLIVCPVKQLPVFPAGYGGCTYPEDWTVGVCSADSIAPYSLDDNTGADFDVLNVVAEKMGFKTVVRNPVRRFSPDGTGCAGRIRRGQEDVSVGLLLMHAVFKLIGRVEFAGVVRNADLIFLAKEPALIPPYFNIVKPFSPLVWAAAGVTAIAAALAMSIILRPGDRGQGPFYFFHWVMKTGISETVVDRQRLSFSVFALPTLVALALLSFSFECNLRAYLMSINKEKPIDNEADLMEQGGKVYLVAGSAFLVWYISPASTGNRRILADRAMANKEEQLYEFDNGRTPASVLDTINREGGAVFMIGPPAKFQFPEIEANYGGVNPFRLGKDTIFAVYTTFLLRPNNRHFNRRVNEIIQRTVEGGISEKLMEHGYIPVKYQKHIRPESKVAKPTPFQVEHLFVAFCVILTGIAAASAVFGCERARGAKKMNMRKAQFELK